MTPPPDSTPPYLHSEWLDLTEDERAEVLRWAATQPTPPTPPPPVCVCSADDGYWHAWTPGRCSGVVPVPPLGGAPIWDANGRLTGHHEAPPPRLRPPPDRQYVCPQCGPDPRGADAHAEQHHTGLLGRWINR